MDGLVEIIKAVWPIVATFGNIVAAAAFLWMKSQFVTKGDFEAVKAELAAMAKALVKLEADDKHEPTRADLNRMTNHMDRRLSGVETGVKALGHQITRIDDYVRALLENELRGAKK